MPGTHYILDRDRPENQNPMDRFKEKACGRCGTVKPNTFQFFGKKLWRTRHDLTTTDICMACQKAKVSQSMKDRWKARKSKDENFENEQTRMAFAQAQANEQAKIVAMKAPDPEAEVVKPLDEPEDHEIKPLTLEEAVDTSESERLLIQRPSEESSADGAARVETESERLMRELLGGI